MRVPRVAYFPDSFHEVNGVAHTSRNFVAYAARAGVPFLCVRAGGREEASLTQVGELRELELARSRTAIRLEKDLQFDAIFWRHYDRIEWELKRFQPDALVLALGFDIYKDDPQSKVSVTTEGFGRLGTAIGALDLPSVIVQEGGYHLESLEANARAFFGGFTAARSR